MARQAGMAEQAELFAALRRAMAAEPFQWATQEEDRSKLWQARHDAFWATKTIRPARTESISTDVCVPISRLAECVEATRIDLEAQWHLWADDWPCGRWQFPCGLFCNHRLTRQDVKQREGGL